MATKNGPVPENPEDMWKFDFDPAELKAKYLHERDKRVRSEHGGQYIVVGEGPKGEKYARWLDDPHSERKEREPMEEEVEVLVLGAGFSGLQMGARLKDFGITDFKIVDTAGDVGGTWYWNRYPGVACDSEAYCYLPLLEELGYMPSARYISGNEIREHCVRLAKHWDLYPHMVFQTKCVDLRWSEDDKRWIVKTDRGDTFRARFLAACGGPINVPHLPDVPGIETFKGHEFHTSRWDYKYTGGNPEKNDLNLVNLKGKRVAIIGTGATAVQCIPYLAEWSKELYVFQRTPSAVAPRENTPTDPAWWKSLPKGWQRDRDRKFNQADLGTEPEDGLDDGFSLSFYSWNSLVREARRAGDNHGHSDAELMQLADFRHMEWLRKRVRDTVKDPKKAELLCPYYNLWVLQAPRLQRHLPRGLQPRQRPRHRHLRSQGHRENHGEGRGRQRHRVRGGLHRLVHGVRGAGVQDGLQDRGQGRPDAGRKVDAGHADRVPLRDPAVGVPEPDLLRADPGDHLAQLPFDLLHLRVDGSIHHQRDGQARGQGVRRRPQGRGRLGRRMHRRQLQEPAAAGPSISCGLHARLLQRGGQPADDRAGGAGGAVRGRHHRVQPDRDGLDEQRRAQRYDSEEVVVPRTVQRWAGPPLWTSQIGRNLSFVTPYRHLVADMFWLFLESRAGASVGPGPLVPPKLSDPTCSLAPFRHGSLRPSPSVHTLHAGLALRRVPRTRPRRGAGRPGTGSPRGHLSPHVHGVQHCPVSEGYGPRAALNDESDSGKGLPMNEAKAEEWRAKAPLAEPSDTGPDDSEIDEFPVSGSSLIAEACDLSVEEVEKVLRGRDCTQRVHTFRVLDYLVANGQAIGAWRMHWTLLELRCFFKAPADHDSKEIIAELFRSKLLQKVDMDILWRIIWEERTHDPLRDARWILGDDVSDAAKADDITLARIERAARRYGHLASNLEALGGHEKPLAEAGPKEQFWSKLRCLSCGKTAEEAGLQKLFKCGGCKPFAVAYCSAECQKADFKGADAIHGAKSARRDGKTTECRTIKQARSRGGSG